jgi:hypothetical protein
MSNLVRVNYAYCTCGMPIGRYQKTYEDAYYRSEGSSKEAIKAVEKSLSTKSPHLLKMCCRNKLMSPRLYQLNDMYGMTIVTDTVSQNKKEEHIYREITASTENLPDVGLVWK